ncbi:MAG: YfbR-like 5'-deoxynucleotidase [Alphaproteobacteria bacterium]
MTPRKKALPRAWQRMLSGRRLDLLDPSPMDIEIEDIAHGLARVARWNGQTTGDHALSVAQHSLLVEQIASELRADLPERWRLAALVHDAPEYVVGDLITPFKSAIGLDYRELEDRLLRAVHIRFGLPGELPKTITTLVKRADKMAAYLEATQLAGFSESEARRFFTVPRGLSEHALRKLRKIVPLPVTAAQTLFVKRFEQLMNSN